MKTLMQQWHELKERDTKPYGQWLEDRAEEMQRELAELKRQLTEMREGYVCYCPSCSAKLQVSQKSIKVLKQGGE